MKREKRLTKRERKALNPGPAAGGQAPRPQNQHIHCVACGKHLESSYFDQPATAVFVRCEHMTEFPACVGCVTKAKELLAEHDRSGQPVRAAAAWHLERLRGPSLTDGGAAAGGGAGPNYTARAGGAVTES
jgi:hypothetical protein